MKDISDRVTGELPYDQAYIDWLATMRKRIAAIEGPIYETDADTKVLWNTYMAYLAPGIRQQHNCRCCQHFFNLYAHLVYFENGIMKSVFWKEHECDADNRAAVAAVELTVLTKRVTNRFWNTTVVAGDYVKGGFDHIAGESTTVSACLGHLTKLRIIGVPEEQYNAAVQFLEANGCQYSASVVGDTLPIHQLGRRMVSTSQNLQQIPKEKKAPAMSKPITITTKTLINELDAANFSDAELYELIRKEEVKIEELGKIKNKPKKLVAEIAEREAGITKLVEFMDSRPNKAT